MLEQKVYQSADYAPGRDMQSAPISHPLHTMPPQQRVAAGMGRHGNNGVGEAIAQ
jgi:hypothetical protein